MSTGRKMNTFQPNSEGLQKRYTAHGIFNILLLFSRSVVLLEFATAHLLLLK